MTDSARENPSSQSSGDFRSGLCSAVRGSGTGTSYGSQSKSTAFCRAVSRTRQAKGQSFFP